jgi:hypothetical protein
LLGADGEVVGVLTRVQHDLEGLVRLEAAKVGDGLFRLTLRLVNQTPIEEAGIGPRDEVSLRALVSAHAILGVSKGEFVSLTDPPECWREAAAKCRNAGVWPVLAGYETRRDTMLVSPIILPDFPRVAPESAGNFFDGTEIDEMLTLRIMTLTDAEKREMASVDARARDLLARVENTTRDQLLGLHGAVRGLLPDSEGSDHG